MKRFALLLLGFTALFIGGFAAFNLIVDPFDVARLVSIPGFNANKTRALSDGGRVAIADNLIRGGYRTVLLGNSRVLRGFPGRMPWPGGVYNAGMNSGSAFELGRAAILAGRSPNTQCAVIALELEDFNSIAKVKGSYWISALSDGSRGRALLRQLLGAGTFRNSIETVRDNLNGETLPPADLAPRYENGAPGVPRQRFELMARDSFRYFRAFTYDPERMRYITTVIDRLTQRGVQVLVLFTPIHAWREEGIFRAGREADYFRMRREALAALAPAIPRTPRAPCVQGPALQVWDFSGYQGVAVSAPPAPDATSSTRFYFEASHFTPVVGQAVVQRFAGLPTEGGPFAAERFGVRIDADTLARHERALRARRAAWLASPGGREATARFDRWAQEDAPGPSAQRFFIDRDDWAALDRDLPARRPPRAAAAS